MELSSRCRELPRAGAGVSAVFGVGAALPLSGPPALRSLPLAGVPQGRAHPAAPVGSRAWRPASLRFGALGLRAPVSRRGRRELGPLASLRVNGPSTPPCPLSCAKFPGKVCTGSAGAVSIPKR